jgi:transcriptional regulator with XRE-family HTH domain
MKEKPEKIRQILAQNIKKRRESLEMTQENLAENAKLSVQTINTIESCRMWVSDKSITRLAKALNIEVFQLFMPNHISIDELDTGQIAVLLEFWQKIKLVVGNIDSQIDYEFKEVLQHPMQQNNIKETEIKKPAKDKPKKRH